MVAVRSSTRTPFKSIVSLIGAFLLSSLLVACSGGGGDGVTGSVGVSGNASKGPVAGGSVTVFRLNADGSRAPDVLALALTDQNGEFQLSLDPGVADYVAVVLSGGTYVDEATGATLTVGSEVLEAWARVPASGDLVVNITPLTSLAAAQAREHIANDGQSLADAVANANAEVSTVLGVGDVHAAALKLPTELSGATQEEINYSLLLAAFSQLDSTEAGLSAFDIVAEIADDVEDNGVWGDGGSSFDLDSMIAAANDFLANNPGITGATLMLEVSGVVDFEAATTVINNNAPVAVDDTLATNEDQMLIITPSALTVNDTDADGDALSIDSFDDSASSGSVALDGSGNLVYTPPADFNGSDTFQYSISDGIATSAAPATVTITVNPVNDAPTLNGTPDTSVAQNSPYSFVPTGNDIDGDTLLYAIVNQPGWTSFDTATGALTGTPDNDDVGTTGGIIISVDDQQGEPDSVQSLPTFDLAVVNVNDAPTISGTPATMVDQDDAYSFTPTAGDIDGDTLLFSIANQPSWAAFNTATGELSGTPNGGDVGTTNGIVISVDDQQGMPNSVQSLPAFNLTVNDLNDAPQITGTPDTSVDEDSAYSFVPGFSDADGDTPLFSIVNQPSWASFDTATGELSGTPRNVDVGTTSGIVISVDDQQGEPNSVQSLPAFDLTVVNTNDAPVLSGSPATRVGELATYSFVPTVNDPDPTNDTLTFSIVNQPGWASFDTGTGELSGTPGSGDVGTTSGIVISVSDGMAPAVSYPAFDLSVLDGFNEALYGAPTVSATTNARREYQANDGITDNASNGWVAGTSGPASIQLDFDSTRAVYRVVLSDLLEAGGQQVLDGLIEFSDGSSIPVGVLPEDGAPKDFVFATRQTDWVRVTLTDASVRYGLAEVAVYSVLDPDQTEVASDLFNDGDATGWTVVENCDPLRGNASWNPAFWFFTGSGNGSSYQQDGDCAGFYAEGVEKGSYSVLDGVAPTGIDLRLSLRADDIGTNNVGNTIGVLFGYQDDDNYYRLDLSHYEGHRKLWKKEGGVFTELGTSPQNYAFGGWNGTLDSASYSADGWVNVRIVHKNDAIIAYLDDVKVLAVEDSSFSGGQVALLCARNEACTFDNVVVLDPPSDPIVGANIVDNFGHTSGEYFVDAGGDLDVWAVVTESSGFDSVEFVADEGTPDEMSLADFTHPYTASFNLLSTGEHTINVYLRDSSDSRIAGSAAQALLPNLGISGIHLVGLGDSITYGLFDDIGADDVSTDGRNTGGGYLPLLNNYLTADNLKPVTALNEGNRGEAGIEAANRILDVVDRTPEAQGYLLIFGANDSGTQPGGGPPIDSGLGTVPDTANPVTFKDAMQKIIDTIEAAGRKVYLSKAPPHLGDPVRDARIQEYNQVIDELVAENGYLYTPPDFHTYFTNNTGEMFDSLHPNGTGYASVARLWCQALNGVDGIICTP